MKDKYKENFEAIYGEFSMEKLESLISKFLDKSFKNSLPATELVVYITGNTASFTFNNVRGSFTTGSEGFRNMKDSVYVTNLILRGNREAMKRFMEDNKDIEEYIMSISPLMKNYYLRVIQSKDDSNQDQTLSEKELPRQ